MKKILITGGHITPAIAVADELRKRDREAEIIFVVRREALEGGGESEEARLVKARGFRSFSISAGRLTRTLSVLSVLGIMRIPFGFFRAFQICVSERPDIIVSFGGYVALPIVLAGWILGIPGVTHEQTRVPGLANRIIAHLAKRVCVSFPETEREFPKHKTVVTGLPLRESLFHPPTKPPFALGKKSLIFVTGGSTGARSLNRLVFPIVPDLINRFNVIHQTGRLDFSNAPKISGYVATPYLEEREYAWAVHHADLVVGRSGANTVGEIAALGKVALFVPLPWSGGDEQFHNADVLVNAGSSQVIRQNNLTPEKLLKMIRTIFRNRETRQRQAQAYARSVPRDAAAVVARQVSEILSHA